MKILLIDNYDSFTWNLVHYLMIAGAEVQVLRNDEIDAEAIKAGDYNGVVLSPGPCTPDEAGLLMHVLSELVHAIPILGVCLRHQASGLHFGCKLEKARKPVHGKSHKIEHTSEGVFQGLPNPMDVGRYHSLILRDIPADAPIKVTATCEGEIMGIKHTQLPIEGVQFHPESILTPQGQELINNWVKSLR